MIQKIKIGLIHEGKVPPDYRVALTPSTAKACLDNHDNIEIIVQNSSTRCYKDEEYQSIGLEVKENVEDCDILLGVKEVPISKLINDKTYFFFSHTIKKQEYNRSLLQEIVSKNITLLDYEKLTDDQGKRLIGFGHYAGLVGAHNALLTYGLKSGFYQLQAAHKHFDYSEMIDSYKSINFPAIKIAITGGGNVTKGAVEIMKAAGATEVLPEEFSSYKGTSMIYAVFQMEHLYVNAEGTFNKNEFYSHPESYKNNFLATTEIADILINGIFWKPEIPKLFEVEDIKNPMWKIKVISDITCDPFGSVPINIGASTIADPVYGISKVTGEKAQAFQDSEDIIDIMAVDNLPNELGRDASQYFSERFQKFILPELFKEHSDILERATICSGGQLTGKYSYLQDFLDGK